MWELFKDLLERVQDRHVLLRKKDMDGKVMDPLITKEVMNLVKRKKEAYKKDMEDSEMCVEHANMLGHSEIKKDMVLDLLKDIKVDKSPGPDGKYPRLLREAREEIAGALTKTFVSSPATGEVLEDSHVANVVSLFKKGNRDNPGNYRP
eukprot:g31521.t1